MFKWLFLFKPEICLKLSKFPHQQKEKSLKFQHSLSSIVSGNEGASRVFKRTSCFLMNSIYFPSEVSRVDSSTFLWWRPSTYPYSVSASFLTSEPHQFLISDVSSKNLSYDPSHSILFQISLCLSWSWIEPVLINVHSPIAMLKCAKSFRLLLMAATVIPLRAPQSNLANSVH